jgi:hypothetical protein
MKQQAVGFFHNFIPSDRFGDLLGGLRLSETIIRVWDYQAESFQKNMIV